MTVETHRLSIETPSRIALLKITGQVQEIVERARITSGLCTVFTQHTTCTTTINENEPLLLQDIERYLKEMAQENPEAPWLHDCLWLRPECPATEPRNAPAHIQSLFTGSGPTVPVIGGKLALGRWQDIIVLELDGPRRREFIVTVNGDGGPRNRMEAYLEEIKPVMAERVRALARMTESEFGELAEQVASRITQGKYLRGALTCLVCEALGGDRDRGLDYGAAIELTHQATLIHDEIIDEHLERRSKVSLWLPSGVRKAVAVGDRLFALVKRRFLELGRDEAQIYVDTLDTITSGVMHELNVGEFVVDLFGGRVSKKLYMKIIKSKTAALFRASCMLGAKAARRDDAVEQLGKYGECLGVSFQIADDIVDLVRWQHGAPWSAELVPMALYYDAMSTKRGLMALIKSGVPEVADAKLREKATADMRRFLSECKASLKGIRLKAGYRDMLEDLPRLSVEAMLAEAGTQDSPAGPS